MNRCPYCGSEEYILKSQVKGTIEWHRRFDGQEVDNGDIYDELDYVDNKYIYCAECGKRLCKVEERSK